jgi:hypothetical protein
LEIQNFISSWEIYSYQGGGGFGNLILHYEYFSPSGWYL